MASTNGYLNEKNGVDVQRFKTSFNRTQIIAATTDMDAGLKKSEWVNCTFLTRYVLFRICKDIWSVYSLH